MRFYGDTISSVGVLHRPSFFFFSLGMWDSLIPAKIRPSKTHSASTEEKRVGGVVGSWRAEAFWGACHHLHPM